MAHGDKPYRVYRGGRAQGSVPLKRKQGPSEGSRATSKGSSERRFHLHRPRLRGRRWKRWTAIVLGVLFLLIVSWALASYFALRAGVQKANKRLGAPAAHALSPMHGLMLTTASNILVLGTDHSSNAARAADDHSDSIMIVHTDPSHHRIVYLSIPRDLRVPIPGYGDDRVNAAFQIGGPALSVKTIGSYTGLPINHVIVVDFGQFKQMIDALGGVDINVPGPILSDRFDCPFSAAKCQSWKGYRFAKGLQYMNGQRALVYSRIRVNQLNPRETDIARGARQQQVVQAVLSKMTGVSTMLQLPWMADDLLKPLATDLTAGELMQLGWIKLRASSTLHCRLGGNSENIGGADEIAPTEDNFSVIRMVQGTEAPREPPAGSSLYAPGCSTSAMLP